MVRIFPNDESALRFIGALLAEFNEQWQTRRCLDRMNLMIELMKKTLASQMFSNLTNCVIKTWDQQNELARMYSTFRT